MFKAELEISKFEEDMLTASSDGIILPDHDWETEEQSYTKRSIYGRFVK